MTVGVGRLEGARCFCRGCQFGWRRASHSEIRRRGWERVSRAHFNHPEEIEALS
jgi:hypothetical protein